jgi:hypothetical protein
MAGVKGARNLTANPDKGMKNFGPYTGSFMYPQKKKSGGVRSGERGGPEIMQIYFLGNFSAQGCKMKMR